MQKTARVFTRSVLQSIGEKISKMALAKNTVNLNFMLVKIIYAISKQSY